MNGNLQEEYTVLSAYLAKLKRKWWVGTHIVSEELKHLTHPAVRFARLKGIQLSTINDFLAKNATPQPIPELFLKHESILAPDAIKDDSGLTARAFWDRFRAENPEVGGYLSISRVGLNAECTQALLEIGLTAGPLTGQGCNHMFVKRNDVWHLESSMNTWIS